MSTGKYGLRNKQRGSVGMMAGAGLMQGGDPALDLQAMSASQEGTGGATASLRLYNAGTREGEQWFDDGFTFTYQNDAITPGSIANDYQMKWDAFSGDPPDIVTTLEGVWESLSVEDFEIAWDAPGGDNFSGGTVTVSIRKGTGPVLQTALWDGDAQSVKKGQ